jgi:hypothetical protein
LCGLAWQRRWSCRSRDGRWQRGLGCNRSGWRRFHHRCATLLAEVATQIQRSFAEAANDGPRMRNLPLKRFLQSFVVEIHPLIAKAGTRVRSSRSRARSHDGSGRDFQRDSGNLPIGLLRRRFSPHDGPWRGRRWCKGRPTLKAETHPVRYTEMAFGASQHTFATNPVEQSAKRPTAYYYTLRHFSSLVRGPLSHGAAIMSLSPAVATASDRRCRSEVNAIYQVGQYRHASIPWRHEGTPAGPSALPGLTNAR